MEEGLPQPDLIVFLDIAKEEQSRRGGFGGERYENSEMQENVRRLFGRFRQDMPEKGLFGTIDGGKEEEVVAGEVERLVKEFIGEMGRGEKVLGRIGAWSDEERRKGDVPF